MDEESIENVIILLNIIIAIGLLVLIFTQLTGKKQDLSINVGGVEINLNASEEDNNTKTTNNDNYIYDVEDDVSISNMISNSLLLINAAENAYTEISMSSDTTSKYTKTSTSKNYLGMCATLKGLIENGYYTKKNNSVSKDGLVLVEVPYDGTIPKITIWYYEGSYGINGIEKDEVSKLSIYNIDYNNQMEEAIYLDGRETISASKINGGPVEVTSNLTAIKDVITKASNKNYSLTLKTNKKHGGTGDSYYNINCINSKI